MTDLWLGLLANLGIISISISIWAYALDWIVSRPEPVRSVVTVILSGATTIALMMTPFQVQPGIYFDLRSVAIAMAGFVAGPIVGIATGVVAAVFRVAIGGVGTSAAIIGVAVVTVIGLAGHFLLAGAPPRNRDVILLAMATAAGSLSGFFFLPDGLWREILPVVAAPAIVLVFVAFVVAGLAIVGDLRRRETARANTIFRGIIDALPEPLNAKDLDGRFVAANPATAELMQAGTVPALIGRTDRDFYPPEVAAVFRKDEEEVLETGKARVIEQSVARTDGFSGWLSTLKAPLRDASGRIIGLLTHNRDISDRKRLEAEHAVSEQRLADALADMADALVMFDAEDRLVLCNDRYREFFPKTAHLRVPGTPFREILRASVASGEQGGVEPDAAEDWIEETCASLHVPGETLIELGDGRWLQTRVRPTADGGSLSVLTDVTANRLAQERLSQLNRQLEALARLDGLTGLMNRRAFDETLETQVRQSARTGAPLSLLLIDVDHFKAFNDAYGHPAGDACLKSIAEILSGGVHRPLDRCARYGGEEFGVILPETPAEGALSVAEAMRDGLRAAGIQHAGSEYGLVTISVGAATLPGGNSGAAVQDLLGSADAALYEAKAAGRNRVAVRQSFPAEAASSQHPTMINAGSATATRR
jgi:diguanylate cyclase (GGDEF)-like protein/PAS domain S-box-containing protein